MSQKSKAVLQNMGGSKPDLYDGGRPSFWQPTESSKRKKKRSASRNKAVKHLRTDNSSDVNYKPLRARDS